MNGEFLEALEQLQKEKGIAMESLLETVQAAMASAYRKHYGVQEEIRIEIDRLNNTMRFFVRRPVRTELEEGEPADATPDEQPTPAEQEAPVPDQAAATAPASTVAVSERTPPALATPALAPDAQAADAEEQPEEEEPEIEYEEEELDASIFGRIAAQTAKQVVVQRIREAEREITFGEYIERIGEVITGEVQRKDGRNVYVSLGRVEALLPPHEQIPGEPYRFNDRLKVFVSAVRKTTKGPEIVVSRSDPSLVTRLLELEVPEVADGIVEIKSVAREPGARSKVAVVSRDEQVDAMGACVGHRGARVQAVVEELGNEKIDIVRWSDDMAKYLESALSPAKVSKVIVREGEQAATVVVPDNQLSLAIGRRGINVRLAARLTGWKIDIRSETQYAQELAGIEEEQVEVPEGGGRVRIYELAKRVAVPTRDLIDVLREEGIEVKSHASTVSAEQAESICELLSGGAEPAAVTEEVDEDLASALAAAAAAMAATEQASEEGEAEPDGQK